MAIPPDILIASTEWEWCIPSNAPLQTTQPRDGGTWRHYKQGINDKISTTARNTLENKGLLVERTNIGMVSSAIGGIICNYFKVSKSQDACETMKCRKLLELLPFYMIQGQRGKKPIECTINLMHRK